MEEKKVLKTRKHNITMENRENLSITGVLDVLTFDEENIIMETEMGTLIIQGVNLHISKLNLDSGDLAVDGEVECIEYSDKEHSGKKGGSLFSKLFK